MPPDSLCFLEQTDFSLILARGAAGSQPLRLEALQEIPLADPAALGAAVRSVFAAESAPVVCALRPKPRMLQLATADEAKRTPGFSGARQLALSQAALAGISPAWLAAAQARDGAAPGAAPWLLSATSAEGQAATAALLDTLKLKSTRSVSAAFNSAGALAATITAPVWLLEIGELGSQALLISREGVLAAGSVTLNLDRIAEAVQAELGLKFRGSAVKLFFNPVYDYSEVGARIAGRLATALKTELAALRGKHDAPAALACTGLPATQQWFTTQLAAALELTAFAPDAKAAGVAFASPELEATVSPAWFGFLRFAGTYRAEPPGPWQAEWLRLDTIAAPAAAKSPVAAPAAVVAPKPTAPVRSVAVVEERQPALATAAVTSYTPEFAGATRATAPAPVKSMAAAPAAPAAPRAVASATVASRLPEFAGAKEAPATALNKPAAPVTAPRPVAPNPVVSFTPKPAGSGQPSTPAPKVAATPASKVPVAPVRVAPAPRPAVPADDRPAAAIAPSGASKHKLVLGVTILAVLLAAGGYYFVQTERQEAARLAAEKTKTEQRLQAEIAKSRLIEQQAKAEAEARKKLEAESARRLAEAESGRERAEQEARTQAAARLANARGTLVIATEPAGATVTVGNLPPRVSPATFSDLKIGRYPVTIALPLYDPAQIEFEIKEDAVTDPGVLQLVRPVGTLELTTEPASVAYEVRPANSLIVLPDARRTGRTPATLADLTPGDYTVTFVRDGWMPHSANVTVERNGTAQAKWSFPNGIVKITSTPAGATVTQDGVSLGVTPLTLDDRVPGDATYQLTMPGYAPDQVSGRIVGGQVVELASRLETYDHISLASELDQQPKVISTVQPKIPYEFRQANRSGQVKIELTVTRDGSTKDLVIMPGSDRTLGPICLKAAAQWKFKPGSIRGLPANVRVIVPFSIETE